jgi:hypothetical protein
MFILSLIYFILHPAASSQYQTYSKYHFCWLPHSLRAKSGLKEMVAFSSAKKTDPGKASQMFHVPVFLYKSHRGNWTGRL